MNNRGITFVTVALLLPPILLALVFGLDLYYYYRINSVLQHAVEVGADIARSKAVMSGVKSFSVPNGSKQSHLDWKAKGGYESKLRSPRTVFENCQGIKADEADDKCSHGSGDSSSSFWVAQEQSKTKAETSLPFAKIWHSYTGGTYRGIDGPNLTHMPFDLYDPDPVVPEFNHAQYLPMVCIKQGCLDSFSEKSTLINGNCKDVRPICWYNEHRADFDGDGREDIVIFNPTGNDDEYDALQEDPTRIADPYGSMDEADFAVYFSSAGYVGQLSGHGYMNLSIHRPPDKPQDIPIIEDYDEDGISDYAVYSPTNGDVHIAYSSYGFSRVVRFSGLRGDPNGTHGLIAIPGRYKHASTGKSAAQLIIISTADDGITSYLGDSLRYKLFFYEFPALDRINLFPPDQVTTVGGLTPSDIYDDYYQLPHAGTSSVPVFTDYNKDGLTEVGYMSWYPRNPAKHLAGSLNLRSRFKPDSSDNNPKTASLLPYDLAYFTTKNKGDVLYYTDSVHGGLWSLSSNDSCSSLSTASPCLDDNGTERVTLIVNRDAKGGADSADPEAISPKRNVWNIPPDLSNRVTGLELVDDQKTAIDTKLTSPRKIAVGPDGVVYIADWSNGRILAVTPDAAGNAIDINSKVEVVLACDPSKSCIDLANWSGSGAIEESSSDVPGQASNKRFSRVKFYPMALEILPDPDALDGYSLAFSDGNAVYVIRSAAPSAVRKGPWGQEGESIIRIAGGANIDFTDPEKIEDLSEESNRTSLWSGVNAIDEEFCPIIDLKFDRKRYQENGRIDLIAASSCSLEPDPQLLDQVLNPPTPPTRTLDDYPMAGAIIRFSNVYTGKQMQVIGGGFFDERDVCGGTTMPNVGGNIGQIDRSEIASIASISNLVQRKVNISSLYEVEDQTGTNDMTVPDKLWQVNDIFNPVDLEIDPFGNIYFINQWNQAKADWDSPGFNCPEPDGFTNHYVQGIYRMNRHTLDIEPIHNPFSYGGNTIPLEWGKWYAPNSDKSDWLNSDLMEKHLLDPWEAPVQNMHLPAVAGLAFDTKRERLLTTAPFMPSGNWAAGITSTSPTPLKAEWERVGFIHRVLLDSDADGQTDFKRTLSDGYWDPGEENDPDIDGDGRTNKQEDLINYRSSFCAELTNYRGSAPVGCRMQERVGMPRQYGVFGIDEALTQPVIVPSFNLVTELFTNPRRYIEFDFFNSETEKLSNTLSRSENYALVFDSKNENYTGAPIGQAVPLHTFHGKGDRCVGFFDCGKHTASTPLTSYTDTKGNDQFGFPLVLGSYLPLENSILTIKWPFSTDYISSYPEEKFDSIGLGCLPIGVATIFRFRSKYLFNTSLLSPDPLSLISNRFSSSGTAITTALANTQCSSAWDPKAFYQLNAAIEPISFRNFFDEDLKSSPPSYFDWPHSWINGDDPITGAESEAKRIFYMIDHDGDGMRDATWLSREVYCPNTPSSTFGSNPADCNTSNHMGPEPFVLATGALRRSSSSTPTNVWPPLDELQISRYPLMEREAFVTEDEFPLNNVPNPFHDPTIPVYYPYGIRFKGYETIGTGNFNLFDPGHALDVGQENTPRNDGFVLALDVEPLMQSFVSNYGDSEDDELPASKDNSSAIHNLFFADEFNLPNDVICEPSDITPGLVPIAIGKVLKSGVKLKDGCLNYSPPPTSGGDANTAYIRMECEAPNNLVCRKIVITYYYKVLGVLRSITVSQDVEPANQDFEEKFRS
ncbi:MAG: hypothetical protein H6619_00535 [Deltaproteobacteria bacterium]|nr:hypothetical protein [Deltaproteobacteria bacterium]